MRTLPRLTSHLAWPQVEGRLQDTPRGWDRPLSGSRQEPASTTVICHPGWGPLNDITWIESPKSDSNGGQRRGEAGEEQEGDKRSLG